MEENFNKVLDLKMPLFDLHIPTRGGKRTSKGLLPDATATINPNSTHNGGISCYKFNGINLFKVLLVILIYYFLLFLLLT